VVWDEAGKRSNRYNFGCMTANTSVFDSTGGFRVNLSNDDIAKVGAAPRRRLSSWPLVHILVFFFIFLRKQIFLSP